MKKINEMNYSEFVGLINERNRPSGSIRTIQDVINAPFHNKTVFTFKSLSCIFTV